MATYAQTKHKYVMKGRAYYDGTSQVYKLDIIDDGSGNFTGENISILPTGERLIGPVRGKIDYQKKMIYFQELQIKNLPPGKSQDDYCFFTITATFTVSGNQTMIVGTFTSKGPRGNKCSGGTIKLVGTMNVEQIRQQYIEQVAAKKATVPKPQLPKPPAPKPKVPVAPAPKVAAPPISKPIPKPPVIKPEPKMTPAPKPKPAEPVVQEVEVAPPTPPPPPPPPAKEIKKEEAFSAPPVIQPTISPEKISVIEYDNDILSVEIHDYDILDGDNISVMLNDKVIVDSVTLTGQTINLKINIPKDGSGRDVDSLKIRANNEGYFYPNSATMTITDGTTKHRFNAENKAFDKTYIILRKRKK